MTSDEFVDLAAEWRPGLMRAAIQPDFDRTEEEDQALESWWKSIRMETRS